MKAVVPEFDQPFTFRGIEVRADDTDEACLAKFARITLDPRFQFVAVVNPQGRLLVCKSGNHASAVTGLPFWEALAQLAPLPILSELRQRIEKVVVQHETDRYDVELSAHTVMDLTLTPVKDGGAV